MADPPGATWEGDAVKEAITGRGGAGVTMTDVTAVKVPASLVARQHVDRRHGGSHHHARPGHGPDARGRSRATSPRRRSRPAWSAGRRRWSRASPRRRRSRAPAPLPRCSCKRPGSVRRGWPARTGGRRRGRNGSCGAPEHNPQWNGRPPRTKMMMASIPGNPSRTTPVVRVAIRGPTKRPGRDDPRWGPSLAAARTGAEQVRHHELPGRRSPSPCSHWVNQWARPPGRPHWHLPSSCSRTCSSVAPGLRCGSSASGSPR